MFDTCETRMIELSSGEEIMTIYRVNHKNVPNLAMMLHYSTIEFKQKEIPF